jgi:hypothetical protein
LVLPEVKCPNDKESTAHPVACGADSVIYNPVRRLQRAPVKTSLPVLSIKSAAPLRPLVQWHMKSIPNNRKKHRTVKSAKARHNRYVLQDLVAMRRWGRKRQITSAVVLLTCLNEILEHGGLQEWLEQRNPRLCSAAPIDLLHTGKWRILAD